jgi:hypothetical protein
MAEAILIQIIICQIFTVSSVDVGYYWLLLLKNMTENKTKKTQTITPSTNFFV